ncbi:MAG: hypothetical protein SOW59_00440 [Corynebacterium sp.]|nr:hypothetical protein [Corynebacterium sp.]
MISSRWALTGVIAGALVLGGCSNLQPEETALSPEGDVTVSTSQQPDFQTQDVPVKTVTTKLNEAVKDEGLNVTWHMQGVYPDSWQGTVVTFLIRNDNDVPLPPEAVGEPKLEIADGMGGYTTVEQLPYDADTNTDLLAPGLDLPLGAGAATNLQYRFNTSTSSLWKARLTIGNVVWEGNLNV